VQSHFLAAEVHLQIRFDHAVLHADGRFVVRVGLAVVQQPGQPRLQVEERGLAGLACAHEQDFEVQRVVYLHEIARAVSLD